MGTSKHVELITAPCIFVHVYICNQSSYADMLICAHVFLCMQTCLCMCCACTDAHPLHRSMPHVAQPRRKTPILSDQKEKQTFWMKVLWSSVRPFIFLVIIIYSRHIDNAPTQTLQGIIHSVRGDVTAPQIVQTTGQSPEPHNSMSERRKKTFCAPLCSYFKDIPSRD